MRGSWVTDEKPGLLPQPHEARTIPRPTLQVGGRRNPPWYLKQEDELREPLDGLHHQPVERDAVGATHLPPLLETRGDNSLSLRSKGPAPGVQMRPIPGSPPRTQDPAQPWAQEKSPGGPWFHSQGSLPPQGSPVQPLTLESLEHHIKVSGLKA